MQFYDLYVKREEGSEDLVQLKQGQFPLDINAEELYNELEVMDFTELFANQCLIEEKFGKTIKVSLTINPSTSQITKRVEEF